MFTGIVQAVGTITKIDRAGDWKLTIKPPANFGEVALGASVACSGICLTVIHAEDGHFQVQISSETMSKTTSAWWNEGTNINLEHALCLGDELGGHIVTGHVDGLARVVERTPEDDSIRYTFEIPPELMRFVAPKGSVALDGISLTVNEVAANRFGINIIPFTQQATTIIERQVGDRMNCEIDTIARYVARMMAVDAGQA